MLDPLQVCPAGSAQHLHNSNRKHILCPTGDIPTNGMRRNKLGNVAPQHFPTRNENSWLLELEKELKNADLLIPVVQIPAHITALFP